MESTMRDSGYKDPMRKVCPHCFEKGTIKFWGPGPGQKDLLGNTKKELAKLDGSRCDVCRETFSPGHKFEEAY